MVRYKIVSVGSRRPYSSCRSFARRQAELSHYSEVGSREKKFRRTGPTFEHHAVRAAAIVSHFEFAPEGFNLAAAGADDLAFPRAPHSRCKLLVKPADFIRICTGCFQTGCFRTMGTSCALRKGSHQRRQRRAAHRLQYLLGSGFLAVAARHWA